MNFKLGQHTVGEGHSVYVIAEAGVNHNGSVNLAKQLVRSAAEAGASCVKFQTFKAERVATPQAPKAEYQLKTTDRKESQLDMLRSLELREGDYREILEECASAGLDFLSTPYSREDVDFLERLNVSAYKVASALFVERHLLRHIAQTGKPAIISTGMGTLAEVEEAVGVWRAAGGRGLVLLQCTTNYPSTLQDVNLRAMQTMRRALDVPVGYSDHTEGETACLAAVALGACVLEKHLTLNRTMSGPDHACSAEPVELRRLVQQVRQVEQALGNGRKEPCEAELQNLTGMRRSIVATRFIRAGQVLSDSMLAAKRPATGISASHWDRVVGRTATADIAPDTLLTWELCGGAPD